jgi:predicted N-acetyltransferase YhbS
LWCWAGWQRIGHQGQGLGRALVADALRRSLAARRLIGARALLVHAIDEQAAAFYRSLGFRPSPLNASTLMLQLSEPVDCQPQPQPQDQAKEVDDHG